MVSGTEGRGQDSRSSTPRCLIAPNFLALPKKDPKESRPLMLRRSQWEALRELAKAHGCAHGDIVGALIEVHLRNFAPSSTCSGLLCQIGRRTCCQGRCEGPPTLNALRHPGRFERYRLTQALGATCKTPIRRRGWSSRTLIVGVFGSDTPSRHLWCFTSVTIWQR